MSSLVARMAAGRGPDEGIHGTLPVGGRRSGPSQEVHLLQLVHLVAKEEQMGRHRITVLLYRSRLSLNSVVTILGYGLTSATITLRSSIYLSVWTTTASLHMEDNAAKWLQVYKL
jgi:hypothetical protein